MSNRNWLVTNDGNCLSCGSFRDWDLLRNEYRLYRFLTEIEDVIKIADQQKTVEENFLPAILRLVRILLLNSHWIQSCVPEPDFKTGTSIRLLYEELGFPMTVQTEISLPGVTSVIHNHGTWGVVAVLKGQQKNSFWRRVSRDESQDRIEQVGEQVLKIGEIICFTSEAIHQIESVGDEPTVTFNLYGETDGNKRLKFDPLSHKARHF
jgi:predicted metal-dependent enzyme (double-stranded beta helix superfamily)